LKGKHVPQGHTASASASYRWLLDVLVGRTNTVTWTAAGELPAGFERADQLAVLPSGPGRSFLVPLATRRAASSALTSYNALRPARRRLERRILGTGLRTGLAQPLLSRKVDIGTAVGVTGEQRAGLMLGEHLSALFGRGPVAIAVGAGGGPYRKPVLQVFGRDGTPLGYVKVGWNDWTRDAVRHEAAALRACAGRSMRLGVPALLDQSTWHGLDLLVTAPLPAGVRRPARGWLPGADVLREISGLSRLRVSELAASPWWLGLRARIRTGVSDPAARASLCRVADGIERSFGHVTLEFGTWHGDFVPWNLARLGTQLYAWDWESSAPDAPLGFDALHFHFQLAFVARRRPLAEAADIADRGARQALADLGIAADSRRLLAPLHLVELAVRHEEARRSTGDVDGRFYPAVLRALEQAARRSQVPMQCADRSA
jgi:hypothetical protein